MTLTTKARGALTVFVAALLLAACASPAGAPGTTNEAPAEATAAATAASDSATHGDAATHDETATDDETATHGDSLPAAAIRIVEPAEGAVLPAGSVIVRVEAEGTPPESLHWHLRVDGEPHNMIDGPETRLDLAPGEHTLTAIVSGGDLHLEDPDAPQSTVNITVEP